MGRNYCIESTFVGLQMERGIHAVLEISGNNFIDCYHQSSYTKEKRRDALRKSSSETDLEGFIQKEMQTKKNEIISKT